MIVSVKLSQTYVKAPRCWIIQGNLFEPEQNVNVCLGDADKKEKAEYIKDYLE